MTVGSLYTIAELRDLIKAKDVEVAALDAAIGAFDATWKTRDPAAESAWQADYQAMRSRYRDARLEADSMIAVSDLNILTPADLDTEGDVPYRAILSALQKTSGVVSPGDLQDLWTRLTNAQGAPIPEPPVPQPTPGSDASLNALQWIQKNTPAPTPKNLGLTAAILSVVAAAFLAATRSPTVVIKRSR